MTLDWTFSMVHVLEGNPTVDLVCSFRDGRSHLLATPQSFPEVIGQMDSVMQLLSYIAYFPNKDFTKIKLDTSGNQFAIHFLDKRWLKSNKGFLGILSVSEFNVDDPFEMWGVEEIMANYIFEYYQDMSIFTDDAKISLQKFQDWLSIEVKSFYKDWNEAKLPHLETKKGPILHSSTDSPLPSEKSPLYEHWWDLQLINEYGQPLSEVISFIDKDAFLIPEESENIARSLESMSISALKILIDQQSGWNICYLKNRLANEMGFSYVFFEKFAVRDVKYLLIMNSSWYSLKEDVCVQRFRGNEFDLLLKLCEKLQMHTLFFTKQGQLETSNKELIQKIILNTVQKGYE